MDNIIEHPFPPLFNKNSKILILGSFPSVKSRENNFFYGHPQNRFWKVLSTVLKEDIPRDIEAKKTMLLKHNIALWDCIASCKIQGSSDSSIKNVVPNDLSKILAHAEIAAIFCNGKKAYELYRKYIEKDYKYNAVCLPSTSPANATWNLDRLINEYTAAFNPYIK